MTTHHHPDLAWLIDYAAGNLTSGFRAVLAGHLHVCNTCREELDSALNIARQLGGHRTEIPAPFNPAAIRARASAAHADSAGAKPAAGLQEVVARALGFDWNALLWRRGWPPTLSIAPLVGDAGEDVSLLRAGPRVALPAHHHGGSELTLVLTGSYASNGVEFTAGDIDEGDPELLHRPIVVGDKPCISLLVYEGALRYSGALGLAQRLFRF